MARLEDQFHAEMLSIYAEVKALGYNATYFLRLVNDVGGVAAARKLVTSPAPSEGFTKLWEMRRLDLSVEARIQDPRWKPLFPVSERMAARKRLEDYGYRTSR